MSLWVQVISNKKGASNMLPIPGKEMEEAIKITARNARNETKLAGVPVTYSVNGKVIKEYPDGRKVVIVTVSGARKEIAYG